MESSTPRPSCLKGPSRENVIRSFDTACREVTNPALKSLVDIDSVGPFRVQGLRPAVASLKAIVAEIIDLAL